MHLKAVDQLKICGYKSPILKMNLPKIKIVIIDDEEDLCFLLSNMLNTYGFEVSYFHNLSSGMEGLRESQPDWVIIDNNLPDGLGWEKVNEITDLVEKVRIIKISASPDSFKAKYREFVHYLIKPIDVNSIVALVNAKSNSGKT